MSHKEEDVPRELNEGLFYLVLWYQQFCIFTCATINLRDRGGAQWPPTKKVMKQLILHPRKLQLFCPFLLFYLKFFTTRKIPLFLLFGCWGNVREERKKKKLDFFISLRGERFTYLPIITIVFITIFCFIKDIDRTMGSVNFNGVF